MRSNLRHAQRVCGFRRTSGKCTGQPRHLFCVSPGGGVRAPVSPPSGRGGMEERRSAGRLPGRVASICPGCHGPPGAPVRRRNGAHARSVRRGVWHVHGGGSDLRRSECSRRRNSGKSSENMSNRCFDGSAACPIRILGVSLQRFLFFRIFFPSAPSSGY